MAHSVRDVMSTNIVTCPSSTPVKDVAKRMRDENIGDVVVTDGGRLQGIVTDRDLVVRCLADRTDLSAATIADAVSRDVVTVRPDTSTKDAAKIMADRSVRRLPVVDDGGSAIGIVSIGDLAIDRDPKSVLAGISAAAPNR